MAKKPGFEGARLPSEAEWEYAAKSGGKNYKYPWGNDKPTCETAIMYTERNFFGIGACPYGGRLHPVCSRPAGNTEQGLCDMSGNMRQWVEDAYQGSYKGVPVDGSAFESSDPSSPRVIRGGSYGSLSDSSELRTDHRAASSRCVDIRPLYGPICVVANYGFRLARSR